MNDTLSNSSETEETGQYRPLSNASPELRERAWKMARFLRLDTLGDLHVSPVGSNGSYEVYAFCPAPSGDLIEVAAGFIIHEDGTIQLTGSYTPDVSPWTLTMGAPDSTRLDVLGDGGGTADGTDARARADSASADVDGDGGDNVDPGLSDVRTDAD